MAYIIKNALHNELIFYKDLNFRDSDSMNDFILVAFFEFSIKSYIFSFL